MSARAGFGRRSFLSGAAASAAGALTLAACGGGGTPAAVGAGDGTGEPAVAQRYPFRGAHQTGISAPVPASGLMAAGRIVADDAAELQAFFRALSDEVDGLMTGRPYEAREPSLPPLHTGAFGDRPPPTDLSIVVSVGASLFDDRYGLAGRAPRALAPMPFLANDRLDPARTHGDILLTINADSPDACIFALRQLLRRTRASMVLAWMVEGFNRRATVGPGQAPVRNLLGFKDGTANPPADDSVVLDRHVWVGADDDEPAWAVGGSYHVVRIIRMLVEFWDRAPLGEQEAIIGRTKDTGAPLGARHETDAPDYAADPEGAVIPLDAHIRLANPRTPDTAEQVMLRRGFSYSRGFDGAGRLDQGLAFASFQRRLETFLAVQARLAGEPLEEYVVPEGGGFFFALPGVTTPDGYLGEGLFSLTP